MTSRIDEIDLSASLSREESEGRVLKAQRRLTQLRLFTAGLIDPHGMGPGLLVLFEGFDAAGKGGAIRRLTASIDPRHVRVVPIAAPTPEELRHHFLWRFQHALPGRGQMTVFDRSWYGRLLVERVDGLIDRPTVKLSAEEIVDFERMLVLDGVTGIKFWLHISAKEQLKRFEERAANPLKQWKLTPDDWRNREQRDEYMKALKDMVALTDHPQSTWQLISAENKHYARATILETLADAWVQDLKHRGLDVPPSREGDYLH